MTVSLGVDVGGTFTDAVVIGPSGISTEKVLTTADQELGVVEASLRVLARAGLRPADVDHFVHGSTVATNALLERRLARTAFVTTRGFRDVLTLARQTRPRLYRLEVHPPAPVVPPERCFEVDERMSPTGVVEPLDAASVDRVAGRLRALDVEAVAVSLLFSYLDPSHERQVAELLRARLPHACVVASHEVAAEVREFERGSTTAIDAALGPPVARCLRRLEAAAREVALPAPLVMLSSGGVATLAEAAAHPARMLLSGPAGGAVATRIAAAAGGYFPTIGLDMGGTSCDTFFLSSETDDGSTVNRHVAGLPVRLPMVDIHTVGAGGGSIAWVDAGRALRIGPRSAGSRPGPACYGRGGTEATVTDANLLLGYLPADAPISHDLQLDVPAATRVLERLARAAGYGSAVEAAEGVYEVAVNALAQAVRVVSVDRGEDPADATLTAFGGAGPLHACALAEQLRIGRVVVLPGSGVLSAFGLAAADRRVDSSRSLMRPLAGTTAERLWADVVALTGRQDLSGDIRAAADLRYVGQSHELSIPFSRGEGAAQLAERFHDEHAARYGYAARGREVELITLRAALVEPRPQPRLSTEAGRRPWQQRRRRIRLRGECAEATVVTTDAFAPGDRVVGPAIVELRGTTCLVLDGWIGSADASGFLVLERGS